VKKQDKAPLHVADAGCQWEELMKRRSLVSAIPALALGSALRARAQAVASAARSGRRYAVLSLIGDQLTYVGASSFSTGTMINHSRYQTLPVIGTPFDSAAAEALAAEVPRHVPGAEANILAAAGSDGWVSQEDWFQGDKVNLPSKLGEILSKEGAELLLLVTKHKGRARITDGHLAEGTGSLSGLGVYRDAGVRTHTEGSSLNFPMVAPFVYGRLSLIDLATATQLRHSDIDTAKLVSDSGQAVVLGMLRQMLVDSLVEGARAVLAED